jgi:hypothetical protein
MTDIKSSAHSTAEEIIAEWKASPGIRAEFHDDLAAFEAFCKNRHLAKVLTGKAERQDARQQ